MKPKSDSKMRLVQIMQWVHAVWPVSVTVICMMLSIRAFTSIDADTLFEAHTKAFCRMTNDGAFYLKSTEINKPANFGRNPKLPHWPPFNERDRATMVFNNDSKVVNDPLQEQRIAIFGTLNFT